MERSITSLAGKTALITGSTAGLGRAFAEGLAGAGCNVVLHGLVPPADVDELRSALADAHGAKVHYIHADLTDPAAIESMVDEVHRVLGGVDILVNNAVVRHFAPVEAFPREAWDAALAVNVSAAFHLVRLTLAGMRSRGWGRIFNMTSVYGSRGTTNRIDYVTTKSALIGMTRAVAMETVGQGITCNALCPGTVLTPNIDMRVRALMQEQGLDRGAAVRRFLAGKQPNEAFIDAAHVAALLVFLCGPASGDINGAVLPMEGGWLAG
jgi:3-hydroxybutyrate dehydrogenase